MRTTSLFLILFAQLGCARQKLENAAIQNQETKKLKCDQREFDRLEILEIGPDGSLLIGELRDRNKLVGLNIPQIVWLKYDNRPPGASQFQIKLYLGAKLQSSIYLVPGILFDPSTMRYCPYPDWRILLKEIDASRK